MVLAAGGGRRFKASLADAGPVAEQNDAAHKLTASFRGRPLAAWAVTAAVDAGFNHVLVVGGAVDLSDVVAEAVGERATVLPNPDWAEGQAGSLAVAVAEAARLGCRAIVVGLADQPLVPASAWRSVGASSGPIVTAVFDKARRPPVKLESTVWDQLPTDGDEGARTLIRMRPELVSEVPCTGNPIDIDTLEDLQRWS